MLELLGVFVRALGGSGGLALGHVRDLSGGVLGALGGSVGVCAGLALLDDGLLDDLGVDNGLLALSAFLALGAAALEAALEASFTTAFLAGVPNSTSSITARGALSPLRLPTLVMRV